MGQKPIRLEQLGISLDDIVVHLQDKAIVKTEVIKEIDTVAVNLLVNQLVTQLVADEISKLPPPPALELSLDESSIRKIVATEIAKIPAPVQKVTNQIVEKLDTKAVQQVIVDELKNKLVEQVNKQVINQEIEKDFKKRNPPPPKKPVLTLAQYKVAANRKIDEKASTLRSRYITTVPGQEAVYAEKVAEATDFITEGYTSDISLFPLLHAEVKATELTPKQVADGIIEKKSQWIHLNAQIEEARIRAKRIIESNKVDTVEKVDKMTNQTLSILDKL